MPRTRISRRPGPSRANGMIDTNFVASRNRDGYSVLVVCSPTETVIARRCTRPCATARHARRHDASSNRGASLCRVEDAARADCEGEARARHAGRWQLAAPCGHAACAFRLHRMDPRSVHGRPAGQKRCARVLLRWVWMPRLPQVRLARSPWAASLSWFTNR